MNNTTNDIILIIIACALWMVGSLTIGVSIQAYHPSFPSRIAVFGGILLIVAATLFFSHALIHPRGKKQ